MIYASIKDFKQALPEDFLQAIAGYNALDETRVQNALNAAASEIDGYLAKVYDLPFTAEKNIRLQDLSVDITAYKIARDYGALTEDIRRRYDDALDYLKLVMNGKSHLPAPLYQKEAIDEKDGLEETKDLRGKPVVHSNPRLFSRQSLKGY